jgi:hypothetical protein
MQIPPDQLQQIIRLILKYTSQDISEKDIPRLVLRLQKKLTDLPTTSIGLALEQIILRQKAGQKFENAKEMLYLKQSLQQATHWQVSQYVAIQMPKEKIVDLTAGIGGDARMFATHNLLQSAVESDNYIRQILRYNLKDFAHIPIMSSWDTVDWSSVTVAYLDPSRRDETGKPIRSMQKWQPNLFTAVPYLLQRVPKVVIKISPAFQETDIQNLPPGWSIEIITHQNILKQALLWYGFDRPRRQATVISKELIETFPGTIPHSSHITHQTGVFYPFPGIRKSHLEQEFLETFGLKKCEGFPKIAEGQIQPNLEKWGRWYTKLDQREGSIGDVQRTLKEMNITACNIIVLEQLPSPPDTMYKKIGAKEGGSHVVFLAGGREKKYTILIAQRLASQN